jgi:hypothetical protein
MNTIKETVPVNDVELNINFYEYDEKDVAVLNRALRHFKNLNKALQELGCRRVVLSELSEVIHCMNTGSVKFKSATNAKGQNLSFDTYSLKKKQTEQIKSTIIKEDCTSFGPKSEEDVIYFYDFYNEGDVDGTHDTYMLNEQDIKALHKVVLNQTKGETFQDQADQGRRPRLSVKKFCADNKIRRKYVARKL